MSTRASGGVTAWLLVALVAGACVPKPLPTYSDPPDASPAGELLEGTLTTSPDSPCLLIRPLGQPPIGLVWSQGYTARGTPVHVHAPDGADVAAEGDLVTLGGGAVREPSPCLTASSFEVYEVSRGAGENAP